MNKVYFVENFHGIQYFLSIIDPKEKNIIVTSGNPHLDKFIDEILPEQDRFVIPRIPCYRFFMLPLLLLYWRNRFSSALSRIRPTDAYFFSKGNNIHFFAVFKNLQSYGACFHFIDGSGGKFLEKKIEEKSILQKTYNKILGLCCGQKIARYECRQWKHFGLEKYPSGEKIKLMQWDQIALKFEISTQKAENAVLIVDGPIQDIPGVDVAATRQKLIKYFKDSVNKEINLKPHISYDGNSFSGSSFENEIKILPSHIPAELVMLRYEDIYFFSTAACYGFSKARKHTLSKLLIFNDREKEKSFWKLYEDYYRDEQIVKEEAF